MTPDTGFWTFLQQGGVMMVFLGLASLVGLAVILEKAWNLRRSMVAPEPVKRALISMLESGAVERAREYCQENALPLTRLVEVALESRELGKDEMREMVEDLGRREASALERWLPILGTVAAVSPLMGLMGTVLGMMETFEVISRVGPGQADRLSGGISEALITTVTGLAIAVPALVFHNLYHARAGRFIQEMETFALHVIRLLTVAEHRRGEAGGASLPSPPSVPAPAASAEGEEG